MENKIYTADGFEEALIGYTYTEDGVRVIYNRNMCIHILMTRDGMDRDEAEDFFSYNVEGSIIKGGPFYMNPINSEDLNDLVDEEFFG